MEIDRETKVSPLIIIIRYVLFKLFIQIAIYTAVDLRYSYTGNNCNFKRIIRSNEKYVDFYRY